MNADNQKALKTIQEILYERSQGDKEHSKHVPKWKTLAGYASNIDVEKNVIPDQQGNIIIAVGTLVIVFNMNVPFSLESKNSKLLAIEQTYNNCEHFIIIMNTISHEKTKFVQQDYNSKNKTIEFFQFQDVLFNKSKHILVPKHTLIDAKEQISNILNMHSLTNIFMLPHILESDPMSRYIYAKKGDIVKVTRSSISSGEHVVYRVCV